MQYKLRTKIWIGDASDDVVFGMGRVKILEAIEQYGSINAAAKELKMSYRAVWGRIKATEDRLEKQLVVRTTGGTSGGGSALTACAKDLIKAFKAFHRQELDEMDERYRQSPIARLLNE